MISKKKLLKNWKVYAILDDSLFPDVEQLLRKFFDLVKSPVDVVQLRFKDLADSSIYRAAKEIVGLAKKNDLPVIINDRPDAVLSLGCSGVHLGRGDVSAGLARKMLGKSAIIGRTIRGPEDLKGIDRKAVDYIAIGPVFRTPLKPGLKKVSRARLRKLCGKADLPVVAIGGINEANVRQLTALGVRTVAFARFGITERNPRKKIEKLRKAMSARNLKRN